MIHLTQQQISSYLDGELQEASTELVRMHMASCDECTLTFARAEEQVEQLSRVLTHDPGAEYFEGFVADVDSLIRTGKVAPRAPARQEAPPLPVVVTPPVGAPKPALVTPAPAPVTPAPITPAPVVAPPVEAAPIATAPKHTPAPKQMPAPRRRESDKRPVPAVPWYIVVILVVIAGSVGVMVSRAPFGRDAARPEPAQSPTPPAVETPTAAQAPSKEPAEPETEARTQPAETAIAEPATPAPPEASPAVAVALPARKAPPTRAERPAPPAKTNDDGPRLVPEPMKSLLPVTRVVTVVETTKAASVAPVPGRLPAPKLAAPPAEPDPFATLLTELHQRVRAAQAATNQAQSDPTAANYETAAARWDTVVSDLRGHAAQPRARFQLAAARFHAWEMHPNAQRSAAAVASLRLYLVFAAPGPERDTAKGWLARLSH